MRCVAVAPMLCAATDQLICASCVAYASMSAMRTYNKIHLATIFIHLPPYTIV